MTIPFLDLFKKLTGRFGSTAVEEPGAPVPIARAPKKPASEKLSKTVLPHATRSFSAPDPFRSAAGVGASRGAAGPALQLGSERITTAAKKTQGSHLPPALARALEPKLERTISLRIADFIEHVPAGYIKPIEILDAAARVSLKASEIEKGMPEKNPTISLPSLYQQVPEIFIKGVRPDDDSRIALPYEKVLAQFQSAHVRSDQQRDPAVPQLDTPILKATIQDSQRFGTKIEPIEGSPIPPIPVRPATAVSIADAEPDAIVKQTARPPTSPRPAVSLYSPLKPASGPATPPTQSPSSPRDESVRSADQPGSPSSPRTSPSGPADRSGSIPFQLSPNGTGASASERVPASSGPPVPTPLPFTPALEKIAFQPAPADKPKAPAPIKLPDQPVATPKEKTPAPTLRAKDETPLKLSLKVVLQNLPAFQLNGDIAAVADEAQVELPMSLIEPQLASGRIVVAPDAFQNALPEKYREMFLLDEARTLVVLPLEEVLKNLPATILKLRDDQEHAQLDKDFETPFSIRAKEDAGRFAAEKKPENKTSEPLTGKAPAVEPKIDIAATAQEKKVDPKEILAQANGLTGVKACAITFSDGLSLAGELPEEVAAEGLCAMAPAILERIAPHVRETKLGTLVAVTVHTTSSAISFFAHGNICLTVLQAEESLPAETRKELAGLSEKLSTHYAKME